MTFVGQRMQRNSLNGWRWEPKMLITEVFQNDMMLVWVAIHLGVYVDIDSTYIYDQIHVYIYIYIYYICIYNGMQAWQ